MHNYIDLYSFCDSIKDMPTEDKQSKQWLSLNEAAKQLGVHPATLRRWADDG
jgi:transposase-like protein